MVIKASVSAGVKRFIPSEFDSSLDNEQVRSFPVFTDKIKHQELFRQLVSNHPKFSCTIIYNGSLIDWRMISYQSLLNVEERFVEGEYGTARDLKLF